MKIDGGWIAALLMAGAGLLGIESQQSTRTTVSAPGISRPAAASTIQPGTKGSVATGPCGEFERTIQNFLWSATPPATAAPPSCYAADQPKSRARFSDLDKAGAGALTARSGTLRFIIAILPDPVHTHFSLTFDRLTESIQQGLQDEGYFYDSSWMPWEKEDHPTSANEKGDADADAREDQPGLILFRKRPPTDIPANVVAPSLEPYRDGLAVLVVGEEPTTGVHKRQFQNALEWISALQPGVGPEAAVPTEGIGILGPSFSGSLPSLAQLLTENRSEIERLSANAPGHKLAVFSGSISSWRLVKWFVRLPDTRERVNFRSFSVDGDTLLRLYRQYLEEQSGSSPPAEQSGILHSEKQNFKASNLAIISEDETAYGVLENTTSGNHPSSSDPCAPGQDGPGPTCLYYPRDISALRDAYQKQSIFATKASPAAVDTAQKTLNTDLADPEGRQHDTIRSYSANQSALSQEAALQQIVSMLKAHESQYIVLRSSNPLDQLFLSHYLRLAYPEGRIVIEGADLLLRRETGAAALSGIMTLSSYPLLPWEHHWTGTAGVFNGHSHRVFAQGSAEGNYVATRFMVHSGCIAQEAPDPVGGELTPESRFLPPNCTGRLIPDYAPPFWAQQDAGRKSSPPTIAHDDQRPAVWLSVLGRDGFWPVAALNEASLNSEQPAGPFHRFGSALVALPVDLTLLLSRWQNDFGEQESGGTAFYPGGSWPPMPLSMKVCLIGVFLWSCFHLQCCLRPSLTVKPVHRAHFVRTGGKAHLALVILGSLTVALVPIILSWGYGAMSITGEPVNHAWWYRAFLPLSWVMSGFALGVNVLIEAISARRKEKPAAAAESAEDSPASIPSVSSDATRHSSAKKQARRLSLLWAEIRTGRKAWLPILLGSLGIYLVASYVLYAAIDFSLEESLLPANRIPTYWRAINLSTGVSPLVPLLALAVGLYCWFWYSLQGLALFGWDRPMLPREKSLLTEKSKGGKQPLLSMFSQKHTAAHIERLCHPFSPQVCLVAAVLFPIVLITTSLLAGGVPIRSLGSRDYSVLFCVAMDLCVSVLLANAWQLLRIWLRLRQLLLSLDRTPLRRTLKALKGYSWGSVWRMGGNVLDVRYKLISRQFETLTHLSNRLSCPGAPDRFAWCRQLKKTQDARTKFAAWYSENWDEWQARDLSHLRGFQKSVAETAGFTMASPLLNQWRSEESSLLAPSDSDERDGKTQAAIPGYIRTAEELVCLVYLGFIQNVLGRMRTLVMSMLWLFIAATVSVATYPFDPRPVLSGAMLLLFLAIGITIVIVYSQMHRDATLSYVTDTEPGKLGLDFWIKLLGFGLGPLLGLLATIFPELPGSLFSWLQPGIASIK